jgi:hypothetical protein
MSGRLSLIAPGNSNLRLGEFGLLAARNQKDFLAYFAKAPGILKNAPKLKVVTQADSLQYPEPQAQPSIGRKTRKSLGQDLYDGFVDPRNDSLKKNVGGVFENAPAKGILMGAGSLIVPRFYNFYVRSQDHKVKFSEFTGHMGELIGTVLGFSMIFWPTRSWRLALAGSIVLGRYFGYFSQVAGEPGD